MKSVLEKQCSSVYGMPIEIEPERDRRGCSEATGGSVCYTDVGSLLKRGFGRKCSYRQAQSQMRRSGRFGRPCFAPRPDSSVVERGPEKAGVGGSIPSLATI